jgi:WD40 repeat protein
MAFCPPNLIATGSYDGDVFIWNMEMESICCQLNANGTCKTIMQKPKAARKAFQPIIHTRSFTETQLKPNEELSSGLRLVFREKRASRKYSIPFNMGTPDIKLLGRRESKKLLPSRMDLCESNDISSLMESAVILSQVEKKRSVADLPSTVEKVDSQAVEIEMDENKANKPLFDKHSEAIEQVCHIWVHTWPHCHTAVLQVLFLSTRVHDNETAIIVSAGAGGWIRFWNIYGGGLLGEFVGLHYNHPDFSSILAMITDDDNVLLFTGCTQGYIKVSAIAWTECCLNLIFKL